MPIKDGTKVRKIYDIVNSGRPSTITIDGKKVYLSKNKINQIKSQSKEHEGGILPLAALLPVVFGAASAMGSIASAGANIARAARGSGIEKEEGETLSAAGSGLFLNPYQGKGVGDFLKSVVKTSSNLTTEGKRALKDTLKKLSDGIIVEKQGDGIFLRPAR